MIYQRNFKTDQSNKMLFIGNLLEPKISIPKKFTTYNLKDKKA